MKLTVEEFLKDVSEHKMIVSQDSGIYRHLRFGAEKDGWHKWFELVTWPGGLAYNGDMGSWMFSRIPDMFIFFRQKNTGSQPIINPSYWQEKIQAESRFGGPSKKFNPDVFKANVIDCLDNYGFNKKQKGIIVKAMEEECVFGGVNEPDVRQRVDEFRFKISTVKTFSFSDIWEISGEDYTYHFLWCLYAIVWGIQQYDIAKLAANV